MSTSVPAAGHTVWRSARVPAAIAVVVLALGIVTALVRGGTDADALDPQSPAPNGSRALAQILTTAGVESQRTDSYDDALAASSGSTVVVPSTALLGGERLERLAAAAATLVVVSPTGEALDALEIPIAVEGYERVRPRSPGCDDAAAQAAGRAVTGGYIYERDDADARVALCYGGSVAIQGGTVVLGAGEVLMNRALGDEGNAALAMRLLGQHENLVWYLPTPADPALRDGDRSFAELIPAGWVFGAAQLAIAAILLALWRGRRLGPVVTEPLPVVVRAAETTEGRARLYRRTGDRAHASEVLRQAVRTRLGAALAMPGSQPQHDATALVAAVAHHSGQDPARVRALLYGDAPATDRDFVALADDLDRLEKGIST